MPDVSLDDLPEGSVDIARTALLDITPADTVGDSATAVAEEGNAYSVRFPCLLSGYPGWNWNVTLASIGDGTPPSVLEVDMLPGEDALLAPDWVPWSDRLADYNTAQELAEQEALRAASGEDDDESDDDDDDDDESDDDDDDDDDESDDDDDDESDDDDDDDDEDESDDEDSDDDDDIEDPTDLTDDIDDVLDGVTFEDDDDAPGDDATPENDDASEDDAASDATVADDAAGSERS
ncbi:DUF3027 domain-containing protein [Planctomonas psychrotolerans]|uniref:DUF3027 domain-containing protein n=1 Tax=Planctomonas psychrotolerans TaxID=2528712 RepID=UPI00123A0999|nr:DUF3027 domain-containing protein [Planctomonas psychrotolerans]